MSFSRIVGNTGGGFTGLVTRGGTANVENNWWGCNTGPSAAPCDTAGTSGGGSVDFDPWLQLRLTASPNSTPVVGESRSLTASFLLNSAGGAVAASNLDVLIGLPVVVECSPAERFPIVVRCDDSAERHGNRDIYRDCRQSAEPHGDRTG